MPDTVAAELADGARDVSLPEQRDVLRPGAALTESERPGADGNRDLDHATSCIRDDGIAPG